MANPQRGEVDLMTDQGARTMRLTLGALAELEAELGAEGLVGVAERFEGGDFTSRDLIALLAAAASLALYCVALQLIVSFAVLMMHLADVTGTHEQAAVLLFGVPLVPLHLRNSQSDEQIRRAASETRWE